MCARLSVCLSVCVSICLEGGGAELHVPHLGVELRVPHLVFVVVITVGGGVGV